MTLIAFFLLSLLVFIIITITGLIICNTKRGEPFSFSISTDNDEFKMANAIPSTNDYENFDNVLEVVLSEYPKSYNAAGQVYNNYE